MKFIVFTLRKIDFKSETRWVFLSKQTIPSQMLYSDHPFSSLLVFYGAKGSLVSIEYSEENRTEIQVIYLENSFSLFSSVIFENDSFLWGIFFSFKKKNKFKNTIFFQVGDQITIYEKYVFGPWIYDHVESHWKTVFFICISVCFIWKKLSLLLKLFHFFFKLTLKMWPGFKKIGGSVTIYV